MIKFVDADSAGLEYTQEEVDELNKLASSPLDYEIGALREQEDDGQYASPSLREILELVKREAESS
jgi:hypothetical protein